MAVNDKNVDAKVGWVAFAGVMMVLAGMFHAVAGLTALLRDTWYVVSGDSLLVLNYTAWGWIHLLAGIFILLAGFSVLHGANWARVVGVILASLSALANLAWLNAYPIWAVIIITIDIVVIHALVVHGGELKLKN